MLRSCVLGIPSPAHCLELVMAQCQINQPPELIAANVGTQACAWHEMWGHFLLSIYRYRLRVAHCMVVVAGGASDLLCFDRSFGRGALVYCVRGMARKKTKVTSHGSTRGRGGTTTRHKGSVLWFYATA